MRRAPWALRPVLVLAIVMTSWLAAAGQSPEGEPKGILIRLDKSGKLEVFEIDPLAVEKAPPSAGLLIWPVGEESERWAFVSPQWKLPPAESYTAGAPASTAQATRGAGASASGVETGQFTTQLEQISPDTSTRDAGVSLLTPAANGRLLTGRPTFRRLPLDKEPHFPAASAVLSADEQFKISITFAAGKDRVDWQDLKVLPPEAKNGLPAGKYVLGPPKDQMGAFVTFVVEDSKESEQILRPVEELAALLKKRSDSLLLQFQLEHLLGFRGDGNAPLYLCDALDVLESVPEKDLTPHLRRQREHLIRCLQSGSAKQADALVSIAPLGDATGIAEVETVRQKIAASQWQEALTALDDAALQKKMQADPRVAGLAHLYRGVVLAESGPAREVEARAAFEEALGKLRNAAPADRFRAHVNYANFLQRSANDRIHNHALQMAAGVAQPFLTTMRNWLAARSHYLAALQLSEKLAAPGQKAAVQVNLARLYALLADVVRSLDVDSQKARSFENGERAAAAIADEFALAVAQAADADNQVRAVAEEVRALLAFRARRDADAEAAARRALTLYLNDGRLAGAENVYRVLALIAERRGDRASRQEALALFRVAQLIAESVRERFPPGNAGLTRAGFFARKAYVSEKIVELLLADDRPAEALQALELAKARSLQDLLAARIMASERRVPPLSQVLAKWPADAAAIEYFLGGEYAYVFVVAPGGKVAAHRLCDRDGKPVDPRKLVERVRKVQWNMEGQAGKIYDRLVARRGYDNSWQDELHGLYDELLPEAARRQIQGAKVVVVVPQHILHYFPFAALVTEVDAKATPKRMARPRFLIDEPFDLIYAPSLTSWRRLPAASARQVFAVGVAEAPGAPALEGVKKDIANLRAVFGTSVRGLLDGEQARESAVKKILNQRGLLFFGAHGLNLADQPLESHLLLMPDEGVSNSATGDVNDGRLTAAELFARRVNADIVVMSACFSGLGDRSPLPGDDLFGLQRAFLQSGARTVVSGLWDVYDGTAPDLMLGLFKNLLDGKPTAAALAGSQRAFLEKLRATGKDEPWLHPYFWAVYTAAGDDRTRFQK